LAQTKKEKKKEKKKKKAFVGVVEAPKPISDCSKIFAPKKNVASRDLEVSYKLDGKNKRKHLN
jgi:hypothetical protein